MHKDRLKFENEDPMEMDLEGDAYASVVPLCCDDHVVSANAVHDLSHS